jgi:hypothetical protein
MTLRVETPERAQQATHLLTPSRMTAMETAHSGAKGAHSGSGGGQFYP